MSTAWDRQAFKIYGIIVTQGPAQARSDGMSEKCPQR